MNPAADGNAPGPALDAELRALARPVEPSHDLWPGIAARLDRPAPAPRVRHRWLWQAAAAVVLVAGSSLLTARLLDGERAAGKITHARPAEAMPASFGASGRLDPGYLEARRQLTTALDARMARLPASTQAKLASNLAELRRAADEINAALAGQPGDPLLEELLLKTYQDELAVLANVNLLTNSLANAPASPADAKRMEL